MLGLDASIPLLIASACYLFVAVSTIGFGIGYLTRPNFTIYHSRALSKEWSELGQELQTLILALMRSATSTYPALCTPPFLSERARLEILLYECSPRQSEL